MSPNFFFEDLTLAQLNLQAPSRKLPVAHDRFRRDGRNRGGFFHAESAEKAQLDHAGFAGIEIEKKGGSSPG